MRLTAEQIAIIRRSTEEVFGADAKVWLFGSRVDDSKRGGDIDLLIRPELPLTAGESLLAKLRFLGKLERGLGERKIDVVVEGPQDQRPIVAQAHREGVPL